MNSDAITLLENIDKKLGMLVDLYGKQLTSPQSAPPEISTPNISPTPVIDPLGHLDFLMSMKGKEEVKDYDELVGLFRKHGIDPGDIRKDSEAWCGKGMRLALVAAGHPDPGDRYNRACHWEDFGETAQDPNQAGVIVVYYTHVGCITRDGGEIGCNVGNAVKVMPAGQNWFGIPIAHREIRI
jgi:hypothetical protein